jgi:hypothetical protein
MQQQTQTNEFIIYKYFNNIINFIKNNIEEFLDNYLSNQNMLDDENINFQEEINQDEWPWPYDDLDYREYSYISSYDGYDGYDN